MAKQTSGGRERGYLVALAQAQQRSLLGQAARFIVVGALSAVIDFSVYHAALHLDVWVHAARALSFVFGTTAAYTLNRRWAFQVPGGARRAAGYALLYGTVFFVIMGVNALALAALPATWWTVSAAWLLSQCFGTTCNFVMLRTVVFCDAGRARLDPERASCSSSASDVMGTAARMHAAMAPRVRNNRVI